MVKKKLDAEGVRRAHQRAEIHRLRHVLGANAEIPTHHLRRQFT